MLKWKLAIRRTEVRVIVIEANTAREAKEIFAKRNVPPFYVQVVENDVIEIQEISFADNGPFI